jgi:predicted N-formylglutamate amidohydrolase
MPYAEIGGDPACGLLLIGDHASNHVPQDIGLGIADALLAEHVAYDIGVDPLGRALCAMLGAPGILGAVSRLVADLNREEDRPTLIPLASDGHDIPGNAALDEAGRAGRIERFWRPYHARISDLVSQLKPKLLISLHSFTPQLRSDPDGARPWEIGILYNEDGRAARLAIPLLEAAGIVTGDEPAWRGERHPLSGHRGPPGSDRWRGGRRALGRHPRADYRRGSRPARLSRHGRLAPRCPTRQDAGQAKRKP